MCINYGSHNACHAYMCTNYDVHNPVLSMYNSWMFPPLRGDRACERYVACWCARDEPVDEPVEELEGGSDGEYGTGAAGSAATAQADEFAWHVVSGALEVAAGLDILSYSTPLEERTDEVWFVGGIQVPVIGVVAVAVVLAGDTYYIHRILVAEGLSGGVWPPGWAAQQGFEAHLHFGPEYPASWLVTPTGKRIELEPFRHVFRSTFRRPWVVADPPCAAV